MAEPVVDLVVMHYPLERFHRCTCGVAITKPGSWYSGEWERAWAEHFVAIVRGVPAASFGEWLENATKRVGPQDYRAWRESGEGYKAFNTIERLAIEQFQSANGARAPISVNLLVEKTRAIWKIHINNTYRAWIADELVRRHPHLADVIRRRKRVKAAPA